MRYRIQTVLETPETTSLVGDLEKKKTRRTTTSDIMSDPLLEPYIPICLSTRPSAMFTALDLMKCLCDSFWAAYYKVGAYRNARYGEVVLRIVPRTYLAYITILCNDHHNSCLCGIRVQISARSGLLSSSRDFSEFPSSPSLYTDSLTQSLSKFTTQARALRAQRPT